MAPKKYNWINVCIFALIITYIYYKIIFSAGAFWGLTISAVIVTLLWWGVRWRFLNITKLSNVLSEALTPRSTVGSLEIIGVYYGAGLLFLLLALLGPWFIFEESMDVGYDGTVPTIRQMFGLWSVEVTTFDYSPGSWVDYDTDIDKLGYSENSDQFREREAVAFITRILVGTEMGIMAIPNGIFLFLASRNLAERGPTMKDLRNLKNIQDKLNLLWKKLTFLQEKNVRITGLIPPLEAIEKNMPGSINVPGLMSDQNFVKCIVAVSSTAIIMGVAAGLYFGEEWPDAMQEDSSVVQGFSDSSSYDEYTYTWGGGWARELVLWIEPLILFGIFYNCREYLRFSEKQNREYSSLIASIQDFENPDFSRFFIDWGAK